VSGIRVAALAALVIVAGAISVLAPASVLAADVVFGEPEARAALGQPIEFSQSFRSPVAPVRVELVTRLADYPGAEVRPADVSGGGPTFVATVQIDDHVRPNTTFLYHLRVTLPDASVSEGPEGRVTVADDRFEWQSESGPTVTVHWYDGDASFGRRALRDAESAVSSASSLLGLTDAGRMDYFIYGSSRALYEALGAGTQGEVGGQYYPPIRTAYAEITRSEANSSWAQQVIAHEVTHHVFDRATRNPYHEPPTWLNEGIAVYVAAGGPEDRAPELRAAVRDGTVLPLDALTEAFPRVSGPFSLAYAESVSAVDFLVERYGRKAVAELAGLYRGGTSDDEAFRAVTGGTLAEFDAAWQALVGADPPPSYGPQPAPAGPLPREWQEETAGGSAVSPGPAQASPGPAAPGEVTPGASPVTSGPSPEAGSGIAGLVPILVIVGLLVAGILAAVVTVEHRGRPGA
jgi:hypothetical protein